MLWSIGAPHRYMLGLALERDGALAPFARPLEDASAGGSRRTHVTRLACPGPPGHR
jgi:hypothetical protein